MLHQYGFKPAGMFDPNTRDVVTCSGADDSVLEHEMTHAQQYGPIAQKLGFLGLKTAAQEELLVL